MIFICRDFLKQRILFRLPWIKLIVFHLFPFCICCCIAKKNIAQNNIAKTTVNGTININNNNNGYRLILPAKHTSNVTIRGFSSDSKLILTSDNKTVKLWDIKTGLLLVDIPVDAKEALLSSDGKKILILSLGKVAIWNCLSGSRTMEFSSNGGYATFASLSRDGSRVAIAWSDETVKIFDIENGKETARCTLPLNVRGLTFSPDGSLLLLYGEATVELRNSSNLLLKERTKHNMAIHGAAFSADGKHILSYSEKEVQLTDVTSWQRLIAVGSAGYIKTAQLTADGGKIFIGMSGDSLGFWSAKSGKQLSSFKMPGMYSAKLSPSETGFIFHDGLYGLSTNINWYSENGKLKHKSSELNIPDNGKNAGTAFITSAAFAPDGKMIAVGYQDGSVYIFEDKDNPVMKLEGQVNRIKFVESSNSGELVAEVDKNNWVRIWDTKNATLKASFSSGHTDFVFRPAFSGNGNRLVTISEDKTGAIWTSNGELVCRLTGHTDELWGVAVSYNGDTVVTSARDGSAIVWNGKTGDKMFVLRHEGNVYHVAISPDQLKVATRCDDNFLRLWDLRTGKLLFKIKANPYSFTFSPDSRYIATASLDHTAKVWNCNTGTLAYKLQHHNEVISVSFSHNGKFIITGSSDQTAKLWNASNGSLIHTLGGQGSVVHSTRFSADDKIVTTGAGFAFRTWDVQSGRVKQKTDIDKLGSDFSLNSDGSKLAVTANYEMQMIKLDSRNDPLSYIGLDTQDYVVKTSGNYYRASPNAARLLHYVNDQGNIVRFEQLDLRFNRPDIVLQESGSNDTAQINAMNRAYLKRLKKLSIDTMLFTAQISLPVADMVDEGIANGNLMSIRLHCYDSLQILDRFNVWVNGVPVYGSKGIVLTGISRKVFDTTLQVLLSAGKNTIETSVMNVNGLESLRTPLFATNDKKTVNPAVHFIGIGINKYASEDLLALRWSVKDVRNLAVTLKQRYPNIIVDTLFDERVTRNNIHGLHAKLEQLNEDDIVIISFSGHGLLNKDLDYFLSTYNIDPAKPELQGLSYEELESLVDGIKPRKKLLLIDACHSGEIDKEDVENVENKEKVGSAVRSSIKVTQKKRLGLSNSFELMKTLFANVSRGTGAVVISAAGGFQYALEKEDLENGVFTYSVIDALTKNDDLSVTELQKHVSQRVLKLTNGLQQPTSRTEANVNDWILKQNEKVFAKKSRIRDQIIPDGDTVLYVKKEAKPEYNSDVPPPPPPPPVLPIRITRSYEFDTAWINKILQEQLRVKTVVLDSGWYFFRCSEKGGVGKLTYYTEENELRRINIAWIVKGKKAETTDYWYNPSLYLVENHSQGEESNGVHHKKIYVAANTPIKVFENGKEINCGKCEDVLDPFGDFRWKYKQRSAESLCQCDAKH